MPKNTSMQLHTPTQHRSPTCGCQDLCKGPHSGGVAPGGVPRLLTACRRAGGHKQLPIHRPRALQQLPVHRARGHVECTCSTSAKHSRAKQQQALAQPCSSCQHSLSKPPRTKHQHIHPVLLEQRGKRDLQQQSTTAPAQLSLAHPHTSHIRHSLIHLGTQSAAHLVQHTAWLALGSGCRSICQCPAAQPACMGQQEGTEQHRKALSEAATPAAQTRLMKTAGAAGQGQAGSGARKPARRS